MDNQYKIQELIDIDMFQRLQEKINKFHRFPSSIIDLDGNILTAVDWQDVCTKFHRQNKECEQECIKSDIYLSSHLTESKSYASYTCPHGLRDNAMPIYVDGIHMANFFSGQFFLEEPNLDYFKEQAKKFGFDEQKYIDAVKKAPVVTQEEVDTYMELIKELIEVITKLGYERIKAIEASRTAELNEDKYSRLFANMNEGVFYISADGRIIDANQSALEILGYKKEEFIGRSSFEKAWEVFDDKGIRIDPESLPSSIALKSGEKVKEKVLSVNHGVTKERVWLSVTATPEFLNGNHKPYRVFVTLRDISKRKEAQAALELSEKQLRQAETVAKMGYYEIDLNTGKATWSDETFRIFGLEPIKGTEPTTETYPNYLHPDDIGKVFDELTRAINTGDDFNLVYRIISKMGTVKYVHSIGQLSKDNPGKMFGTFSDITDRILIEEELQEKEKKLQIALEAAIADTWEMDLLRNSLIYGDRWAKHMGYDSREIDYKIEAARKLVHPDDEPMATYALNSYALGLTKDYEVECRMKKKDGSYCWILSRGTAIEHSPDGLPTKILGVVFDITKKKFAEQTIIEQQKILTTIFDNSPYIMMLVDSNGTIVDINRMGAIFAGKSKANSLGLLGGEIFNCINSLTVEGCGRSQDCSKCPIRNRVNHTFRTKESFLNEEGSLTLVIDGQPKEMHLLISTSSIKHSESDVVLVSILDITDRKNAEIDLNNMVKLQKLLMNMATNFINVDLIEVEFEISHSLEFLGQYVDADRAYIFDYDWNRKIATNTYEWCNEGTEPQIDQLQDVPVDLMPRWVEIHSNGNMVHIPDLMELPENDPERLFLEPQGIKSLISIPLMNGNNCLGFVGFDFVKNTHAISEKEIVLLTLFAEMLVNIRLRKSADLALRLSEDRLQSIFRVAPTGIGVVKNRVLIDINPKICDMTGYSRDELIGQSAVMLYPSQKEFEFVGKEKYRQIAEFGTGAVETQWKRKDGVIIDIFLSSTPINFNDHSQGVTFTALDITKRKLAEEALERRVIALTQPLDSVEGLKFDDLFNINDIQKLQNEFAEAAGVASIITYPDGKPITEASNFCRLCKDIIRGTEKGLANCFKSDAALGKYNPEGPIVQPCLSGGLWDAGAAISVGGKHLANWLIGQVRDESQTLDRIIEYARIIGADEAEAVKAFSEVPSMSREQFDKVASALFTLANQLSTMAYQNVQQARFISERKVIEDNLIKTLSLIEATLESTDNGILVVDKYNKVQRTNRRFAEMWSIDFEIIYDVDDESLLNSVIEKIKYKDEFVKIVKDYYSNTEKIGLDLVYLNNGSIFERYTRPMKINGITEGRVWSFRDITERKKAEDALMESEAKFRAAFLTSPDSININKIDGEYVVVNEGFTRISGYSSDEVIGKKSSDFDIWVNPSDREILIDTLKNQGYIDNMESQFRMKDGSIRTGLMSAKIILINNEPHTLSITRDITQLRQAHEALMESEEKYRLVVDNAQQSILVAQGEYLKFANPFTTIITQFSIEEMTSIPFMEFVHEDDRAMVGKRYVQRIQGLDIEPRYEFRIKRKDTTPRWVEINAIRVIWEGQPATLNFLTDITDRKRTEEELQKIAKLESVGVMAGGIAHNFKNILASISLNSGFARLKPDKSSNYLDKIDMLIDQASALATRFQTFSTGGEPVKALVDLKVIITEAESMAMSGSNILTNFRFGDDLKYLEADAKQLNEVFMNLLINAKQAMPFGGQINISVENFSHDGKRFINLPKGEYLKIRIEDQGVGISKNNLGKIFDPFFTTKQEGHGLGLSSVHYIITKHGGYITVDSEIDVGTKFEILLPATEKKLIEQNTRDIQPEQGSSDKVLFMDDDDMIRENIIEFGDLLNYNIEGAENGEKAIELYKQAIADGSPYKAVILDLTVKGGMGGEETLIELKKIDPNVKAIVFSGHSTKPIVANYREYGFIGKLEKPASISSVAKVLEEALKS